MEALHSAYAIASMGFKVDLHVTTTLIDCNDVRVDNNVRDVASSICVRNRHTYIRWRTDIAEK